MRVLLAEDSRVIRKMLAARLVKWGYQVVEAEDGLAAWNILQGPDGPHLVLLDWMMPGMDGIDVCKKVRGSGEGPYRYIIMLTGKGEAEDIVAGLNAGADDYLTKPVTEEELRVRLRAGERILDLQEELLIVQEQLRYQATHDALTRLYNRGAILEVCRREFARAAREKRPVSLVLADVDHFKRVNDTFGHGAGDIVLKEVSDLLRQSIRVYDSLGRYGGEEFLFVLPGCGSEEARIQTERVRRRLAETRINVGELEIAVTLSLGIASYGGNGPVDIEAVVEAADTALYRAKESGRDRVEIAS